jgi:hypothetical protein
VEKPFILERSSSLDVFALEEGVVEVFALLSRIDPLLDAAFPVSAAAAADAFAPGKIDEVLSTASVTVGAVGIDKETMYTVIPVDH